MGNTFKNKEPPSIRLNFSRNLITNISYDRYELLEKPNDGRWWAVWDLNP